MIFLLIVIYRSPMFLFIPLAAVIFAEILSRSIGYGVSELGVTINGQSSSIMSVLVLGAGTDYALLLVARYREELHHTADKHEAMRAALRLGRAGDLRLGGDRDRRAALPDDRQGQRHLRPGPDRRDRHRLRGALDADPAAGAADDLRPPRLLALRPAHAGDGPRRGASPSGPRATAIVEGSGVRALLLGDRRLPARPGAAAAGAAQLAAAQAHAAGAIPSLIVGPLDRAVFTPYEMRRYRLEHAADATHGFWARVGDRVAVSPRRIMLGSIAVLLICCAGFAFFSTDLTSEDSYRTEVESVEGQHLLDKSFPSGADARSTDIVVPNRADVPAVRARSRGSTASRRSPGRSPKGDAGDADPGDARTEPLLDRGLRPGRTDPRRGARGRARHARRRPDRGRIRRPRRGRLGLDGDPADHPARRLPDPDRLLRAVIAPLVLIGTVILSFLAALGVGYFVFDVIFGFPGSDPSLPLFAFVFLVALGSTTTSSSIARAREETHQARHPNRASCAPSRSPAASSPAPASSSPAPSRCSPCSPSPSSPSSGSSSRSACCSTPSSSAACSCRRSPS